LGSKSAAAIATRAKRIVEAKVFIFLETKRDNCMDSEALDNGKDHQVKY
jgi:hypothetical protein